jgi:chromosome segregation protein
VRIKSLELNGFKSFVDKTVLRFEAGITAVVGPNGCGKSNVVDAMRWAMGEQSPRRLRGKGMEDIIFGGSDERSQVGMAEVRLTFDNAEGGGPPEFSSYNEIQVARRLYRSGESEYLLNGTECRLKDVLDFFRDTGIGTKGYTIVEQGRIAEIVSARPEDRRILIEEAAGIGKYKARRREAESKIKSTEQNLLRVNDVLTEVRRQIGSIERAARKAARYKRLRETVRVLELSLAVDDRRELLEATEAARQRLTRLRDEVTALETQVAERELAVQTKRLELVERERALNQGTEALLALRTDIKHHEGQIEFGRRERTSLAETAEARREELGALGEQLETQEAEAHQSEEELRILEGAVESEAEVLARAERAAAEAREQVRALESERDTANTELVEVLTSIARSEDRLGALEDRRAQIDTRMRSADAALEVGQSEARSVDQEQQSLEEGLRGLLAERDRLMGLVREGLETQERVTTRERQAAADLAESREKREMSRARLASLREVLERNDDVAEGNRFVLARDEESRRSFGIRGLVRDAMEVDREVERAVEAVLADRAEAIVVDRAEGAVSALEALRSAQAGRGVFVAISDSGPAEGGIVPLGDPLLDRVRPREGFGDLARALLTGVNLVGSLREVLDVYGASNLPATFVTRQGDVLTRDGTVRGGDDAASGGLLGRVGEIRELETEVAELEARVASQESEHQEAEQARVRAVDELENLRNRHHTAALAVANHEKDLERTRERVKSLGETHTGRVAERSELLDESETLELERDSQARSLEQARSDRATRQRDLESLVLRVGSAGREASRLETVATERRVEHAGRADRRDRLRAAFERSAAALAETRAWITRREGEIETAEARREELASTIGRSESALESLLNQEEEARTSNESKREAYESVAEALSQLEDGVRDARGEIAGRRDGVGRAELEAQEAELKLTHLSDSIQEKWGVDLASWTPPQVEPVATSEQPAPESSAAAQGEAVAPEGRRVGARRRPRRPRQRRVGSEAGTGTSRGGRPLPQAAPEPGRREPGRDRGARRAERAHALPRGAEGRPGSDPGVVARRHRAHQSHQPQALPRGVRADQQALLGELSAPVPRRKGQPLAHRERGRARGGHRDPGPASREATTERKPALGW